MSNDKPRINIAVLGHVDHGKSTLIGHLLYKLGVIDLKTISDYEQQAHLVGKDSFKFAWVLDSLRDERERGITINITHKQFETQKFNVNIIDTPGHRDFIKNMITGTSQADAAILVVSALGNQFEEAYDPYGQAREHAQIAYTLGIKNLIVAINKMDYTGYENVKDRYEEVKKDIRTMLKTMGFQQAHEFNYIPTSGWAGDNLVERCPKMGWYDGPCLIEAIDQLKTPFYQANKPLRLPIHDVFNVKGVGMVIAGRVEYGVLQPGMAVKIAPSVQIATVRSIQMSLNQRQEAKPGDIVGFSVNGVSEDFVKKGYVVGNTENDPPADCDGFTAIVIIRNRATPIRPGYTPVLHCHTSYTSCRFEEFIAQLNAQTSAIEAEHPAEIVQGQGVLVRIAPKKSLCVEAYSDYPALGRFTVRDMRRTIGFGVIKEVVKSQELGISVCDDQ